MSYTVYGYRSAVRALTSKHINGRMDDSIMIRCYAVNKYDWISFAIIVRITIESSAITSGPMDKSGQCKC